MFPNSDDSILGFDLGKPVILGAGDLVEDVVSLAFGRSVVATGILLFSMCLRLLDFSVKKVSGKAAPIATMLCM